MQLQDTLARPYTATAAPSTSRVGQLAEALCGLPLFWKVLIANCVVVLLGVALGTWFTLRFVAGAGGQVHWEPVAVMLVVGFAVSVLINAVVLNLALQPLHALERTIDRVATGDISARVQRVLFRDPDVDRLSETLNAMLNVVHQHREQLKKISAQVLAAQEDERKRIARELHDETAQSLTTLLVGLKMLEKARDADDLRQQVHELRQLTVRTLEEVRDLAVELRPTTLDNLGLVAALDAHIEAYAARIPVDVEFTVDGFEGQGRLDPQAELVLYRVVQEALTNAAKHAAATHVRVRIERAQHRTVATIADDGRGFDVAEVMRSRERGLGLFGMQERLTLVQGDLIIESAPGRGTRVTASLPNSGTTGQVWPAIGGALEPARH